MKALRVSVPVLALLALPIVAASAQAQNGDKCGFAAARASGQASGLATAPGQVKKCPAPVPVPPPPSPETPPSGSHVSKGLVYEDVDGDGVFSMFFGEFGIAGQTVRLIWSGRVIAEQVSDANGQYWFGGLGGSPEAPATYSVCVVGPAGYNRTQPLNGDACDGAGYVFTNTNGFTTHVERNFGFTLIQ